MRKLGFAALAVMAIPALMAAISSVGHAQGEKTLGPKPDAGTVNTLDRLCQERFQTIDMKSFGIRRIPVMPEHSELVRIKPETKAEQAVIADLKREGWDGLLMVAGQSAVSASKYLKQHPETAKRELALLAQSQTALEATPREPSLDYALIRTISRPVVLTGKPSAVFPTSRQILPSVDDAFKTAGKTGSYEFRAGEWYVVARPIRASKAECLGCHQKNADGQKVRVGDPVGLALYAFSRPNAPAVQ